MPNGLSSSPPPPSCFMIKPMKMSVYRLAKELHVPAPRVNDIVLQKRGVTADTAVRLAKLFGTSEQFWLGMQAAYEVSVFKAENRDLLAQIKPWNGAPAHAL